MSAIKRSRVSESAGRKFVEFEIASQLIAVSTKVQKEIVYQWSVWKRYSEFESIHAVLKKSLGTFLVCILCVLLFLL
jgi:quinol-cytochrome oxidoreductase complex cytochrome b subunit